MCRYFRIVFVFLLLAPFIFAPAPVFALSLGSLVVNQGNDGRFLALVEVKNEQHVPVHLSIGTPLDYRRLDLLPPRFLSELTVTPSSRKLPEKDFFIVSSRSVITAPEFDLVLKAESNGGVILKYYQIIQSNQVKLFLKGDETPVSTEGESLVSLIPQETVSPETKGNSGYRKALPAQTETGGTAQKDLTVQTARKKQNKTIDVTDASQAPLVRKAVKNIEKNAYVKKEAIHWVNNYSGFYGPTMAGETPRSIVKKLQIPPALSKQAELLLIQDNPNQFTKSAHFIVKEGRYITYREIIPRALALSSDDAEKELNALGVTRHKEVKPPRLRQNTGGENNPENTFTIDYYPPAKMGALKEVWELYQKWLTTWQNSQFNKHMDLISRNFANGKEQSYNAFARYKGAIFKRFPYPHITVSNLRMKVLHGHVYLFFLQKFQTDDYTSEGAKILKFVHEQNGWKITYERFFSYLRNASHSPYTVHVASFRLPRNAYNKARELEDKGYNPYVARFDLGEIGTWYRVLAERLAIKEEGMVLAKKLNESGLSRRQAVLYLPYTLEVSGKYSETFIQKHAQGLKPYILFRQEKENRESFPKPHLLIGAYATRADAEAAQAQLYQQGLKTTLFAP